MVVVVNDPTDYYVAAMRSNLFPNWTHSVSDLRMAAVPRAGLCISVDLDDHVWPINAIVNDGGFIYLTALHAGHLPMVWSWQNLAGRFRHCGSRKCFYSKSAVLIIFLFL